MKLIPNAITSRVARQTLLASKQSPTLLFGVGVVGVVGSTVLACRATLKLQSVLDDANNNLEIAKSIVHEDYSDQDRTKDVTLIYVQSAVKVATLYGPSIVLGAASIGALTASHNILSRRNVALTAAYAGIERAFNEYRERVIDKYGEKQDREFRYETEQVDVIEKGKKKTVTRVGPGAESMYARFFDPLSHSWNKEPEYNLLFLRAQQNYANDLLKSRGHLFLNEVYNMLGIPHSQAGAVVGWVLSDEGDNFIDFGIFDGENQVARDFVNGREGSILLDFNVDGVIWDKIPDRRRGSLAWQS